MSTVKDLKDYKKELYTSQTRELEAFEKNFILISAGILTFSITFIKEIVKIENATLLFFMFCGWGLIIIAIGLMMWAFLKSANASAELSTHINVFLASISKFDPSDLLTTQDLHAYKQSSSLIFEKNVKSLKSIRYWAVRTFIAGVASFSFFVGYNLLQEKNHGKLESNKSDSCSATIRVTHANLTIECSSNDTLGSIKKCNISHKKAATKPMQK